MSTSKKLIIISIIILALSGGVFALYFRDEPAKQLLEENQTESKEKNTQTEAEVHNDEPPLNNTGDNEEEIEENNQTNKQQVNPIITSATGGDPVKIRAIVDGVTSGTCTVVFSKDGQKDITKTAQVALVATYYACQGFNIPKSNFPSRGEWKVKVEYVSDVAEGISETKTILIN